MKVYPMFIELSLHLGNIQTLLTRNQILYTDKKFKSPDDEIVLSDLKVKDIPNLSDEERDEYKKILKYSQPKASPLLEKPNRHFNTGRCRPSDTCKLFEYQHR